MKLISADVPWNPANWHNCRSSCMLSLIVLTLPNTFSAVGSIELGELLCDSLDKVPDSTLLRFAIGSTQVTSSCTCFAVGGRKQIGRNAALVDDGSTRDYTPCTLTPTLRLNKIFHIPSSPPSFFVRSHTTFPTDGDR